MYTRVRSRTGSRSGFFGILPQIPIFLRFSGFNPENPVPKKNLNSSPVTGSRNMKFPYSSLNTASIKHVVPVLTLSNSAFTIKTV